MAVSSSAFEYLKGMRWRAMSEKYSLASLAVEVPKPDKQGIADFNINTSWIINDLLFYDESRLWEHFLTAIIKFIYQVHPNKA